MKPISRSAPASAATVALIYLAFGYAWILLSDLGASLLAGGDEDRLTLLQRWKGTGFVTASAVVLFIVVRIHAKRVLAAHERLTRAYDDTLRGWASALDVRDHSTAQHTARVTRISVALARHVGLEGAALEHLERGATLHDIGKMGVSDTILGKPGPLTESEWAVMRQHPRLAVEMLRDIEYLQPALAIPWCHHERWDGMGYPRGLRGTDIPLEARLFAVVDVYDAVTNVRPYRSPMSHAHALEVIREGSGTQFDPDAVTAFLELAGDPTFTRTYSIA